MRVLFVNPPWIKRDGNVWRDVASVMPPLGLAWMAACLERAGHEARILDAHAERLDFERVRTRLRDLGTFDIVGITATTALITNALEIARIVKEETPDSRIVLGGVHPTIAPGEALEEPAVDLVVRGEGEETIVEIAEGRDLATIAGVSFRRDGEIVHNEDRPLIEDLDSLPAPAYHLLPMQRYHPAVGAYQRLPGSSILATRGCPGRCTFCYRIFGHKLRARSGRKVAEEARLLHDRYGIREISFYDDTFTAFRKEVHAFCDVLDEFGLDLTWSCFSRVDTINEEMLVRMKEAGCHQIMFGIETASAEILKNIHKRTDLSKAEEAVRLAKKVGIDVRAAFMLGNPGETVETMEETLQFALRLNPEYAVFNITTPYPGTEMFDWADENGHLLTRDWERYDLAQPVMELPTVSNETVQAFYRQAHRRFYLRPKYVLSRVARLRNPHDLRNAFRGLLAVLGV